MARQDNGASALKHAYERGYKSFFTVEANERGFMHNPSNRYTPGTLTFKEFERGYNAAFSHTQQHGYEFVKERVM